MRRFLSLIFIVVMLAACNNGGNSGEGIGDSMDMDPTAQPITTQPDTVGPNNSDSLSINQNQ